MSLFAAVPSGDWAALFVGLAGLLIGYLQSRDRLPKWARQWLSRIGPENVQSAIEYADRLQGMSADEKRQEAVAFLVRLSEKELGFSVPTSVANLLVEFVYQQWKRRI